MAEKIPLRAVPSLAEVAANPVLLRQLPVDILVGLRSETTGLTADIEAQLLLLAADGRRRPAESDHLILIEDAARLLATSVDSLHRRWRQLPFAFKDPIDGKIKFSANGIQKHIAERTGH